jgi:hypothetical protein
MKSRVMRWAGHVARMGEMRNSYKILVGYVKGRDHSEDSGVDGKVWIGFIWLRIGTSGRLL